MPSTPNSQCAECGAAFYVRPSVKAQGMGRYCSKSCSNRGANPAKANMMPADVEAKIIANYRNGMSRYTAGTEFGYGRGGVVCVLRRNGIAPRDKSQAQTGRHLSPEHRRRISEAHCDVSGAKNPMFGKEPGHGRSTFVPHLGRNVRSTWEATVATALKDLGIAHEFESRRISLTGCTYLPDFYLPDFDLYIEVKGWLNERAKRVTALMAEERPDVRLLMIGKQEYGTICADAENLRALITNDLIAA